MPFIFVWAGPFGCLEQCPLNLTTRLLDIQVPGQGIDSPALFHEFVQSSDVAGSEHYAMDIRTFAN